ncbi:MAG: sulfatase-like hydrolase/transferase [Thermoplasmata archaeon]|nr:sulfatase-like hydrolase/transferase [Thermoplasmata archaeon]
MRSGTPNIVVIVLDCVRQKNLESRDGVSPPSTPALDRLRTEGMEFTHAVAAANWTLPSHMSLLSGLYPSSHRVRSVQRRSRATVPLLAERLRASGFSTALFTEQAHLSSDSGLAEGYEYCRTSGNSVGEVSGLATGLPIPGTAKASVMDALARLFKGRRAALALPVGFLVHRERLQLKERLTAPTLVEEACRWISGRPRDRPFHLLLNCVDAHEPYTLRGPGLPPLRPSELLGLLPASLLLQTSERSRRAALERLEQAYVLEIARADRKVGLILGALERTGLLGESAVFVTSDHGQQFGEEGNVFHSGGVSDAVARVPLLARLPDTMRLRGRSDRWTSLCSISDWSLALAVGEPPFEGSGERISPNGRTSREAPAVFCEGSPAHEVNSVFAMRFMSASWNHRLVARYDQEGKAVLDLDTGTLGRWSGNGDHDRPPREIVVGEEAVQLAARLFPAPMREGPSELPFLQREPKSITPIEEHLAAWGYS